MNAFEVHKFFYNITVMYNIKDEYWDWLYESAGAEFE